jgi:cytoskeletal protein CcmA (bactofilin family)
MFTKKPEREAGDTLQRITERSGGESPSPVTERSPSYARGPAPTKMVPSIIGEDLIITGNVDSKGEIQVDGEIRGDVHCGSLLLGDKSTITGSVTAEDVVVRGKVIGAVRGLRVTLQAQSHVEGDIFHQSLAIEQGAYFEGKSRRSDDPLKEGLTSKPSTVADKTPRFDSKPQIEVRVERPAETPTASQSPTRAAE